MGSEAQLLVVIAAATVVMAVVQLGFVAYGIRVARRIDRVAAMVEREIGPALGRVDTISADVARAAALTVAQVERVDKVVGQLAAGADEAMAAARDSVVEPVRQGGAFLVGLRAALSRSGTRAGRRTRSRGNAPKQGRTAAPRRLDERTIGR